MKGPARVLLALGAFGFTTIEVIAATPQCPPAIEVRQQLATQVPGWTSIDDDSPHRLANITFYDGKPEEHVSLVPDTSHKSGDRETSTWRFREQADRRLWMACGYGGTSISLAHELPVETHACTVVYNLRRRVDGLPVIESVSCN